MAYQFSIRSSVRRRSQKCVFTLGQDGTELHVDAHGQHTEVCVHCGSRRHRIARRRSRSTLTEVCVHCGSRRHNCTSTLTVNTHRSVCPLWVKTAQLHVDAHGQHSQKCVSTVGQDGTIARRRSRSTLTEVCVHCGSRRHRIVRRRSRSTLTEVCVHCGSRRHRIVRRRSRSTLTEVCVHCGLRRHAYGWFHTRDIWEASQTVSDQIQTERTTSKWFTICLMYMDLGSTLQCASTPVGPYWFHVPSWET